MLIALAAIYVSSTPDAVVTARFFKPGNQASWLRIYIWHGVEHAFEPITPDGANYANAQWAGSDEIVYQSMPIKGSGRVRLYSYNISTKRTAEVHSRLIKNAPAENVTGELPFSYRRRGEAQWVIKDDIYQVDNQQLRRTGELILLDPESSGLSVSKVPIEWESDNENYENAILKRGGKKLRLLNYNRVSEYLKGRSEMETFAVSTSFICRLDWKNEKATKVIRDYLDADFQVNNPWWGASIDGTPGYDDGTQLEYSYPYIGNWETGQKWQLTAQFGIVKSVCLRPTELTMRNLK